MQQSETRHRPQRQICYAWLAKGPEVNLAKDGPMDVLKSSAEGENGAGHICFRRRKELEVGVECPGGAPAVRDHFESRQGPSAWPIGMLSRPWCGGCS